MLPIDPNQTIEYVPVADRELPVEQRSVFLVRPLTHREDSAIQAKFGGIESDGKGKLRMTGNSGFRAAAALDAGLMGWRNFPPGAADNAGFAVASEGKRDETLSRRLADATLDRLPADFRIELANVITDGLGVSEADEGNSAPPSAS